MPARERAALARALIIFIASIGVAGLLIGVLNAPFETIATTSANMTQTSQAAQGRQWIQMFWDGLPFIVAFLGFIQLLGAAAAERRLPGQ